MSLDIQASNTVELGCPIIIVRICSSILFGMSYRIEREQLRCNDELELSIEGLGISGSI
jgi:hypothetical protein